MTLPRTVRLFFYFIGLTLAALILATLALIWLVDPNDYRDDIQAWVEEQTGRKLHIADDLRLSLWPWIGIETGPASLANPPGFSQAPFVRIGHAALHARLLPLFQGKLEIGRITLHDLEVNLETDSQGRVNWTFPRNETATPDHQETGSAAPPAPLATLAIGGIELKNATMRWLNRREDRNYVIDRLDLTTGPILPGSPVRFNGRARIASQQPQLAGQAGLSGTVTVPVDLSAIVIRPLEFALQLQGPALPDGRLSLNLRTDVILNPEPETLRLRGFTVTLDETSRLTGEVRLTGFEQPAVRFSTAIDRLDLDHYLSAQDETVAAPPAGAATSGILALPVAELRALDLQGDLAVGELKTAGLRISDFKASVEARQGLLRLQPTARLYGGRYLGDATLDVRGPTPRFTLDERLEAIQIAPLLKDALDRDFLAGNAVVALRLRGSGLTTEELWQSLAGSAQLVLRDGTVKGVNLGRLTREAMALIKGEKAPAADTRRTDFTELTATLNLAGNKVRNEDLHLKAPFLRARGQGEADLQAWRIDYRLRVRLVESAAGQGGADKAAGLEIPVRISGRLDQPRFELDRDFIEQEVQRKAKKKLRKQLEKQLRNKGDSLEQEVQQRLEDALEHLF